LTVGGTERTSNRFVWLDLEGERLNAMTDFPPRSPPTIMALAEFARASMEASTLLVSTPFISQAPRGDGHDVLLLPGLALSEYSTLLLQGYLRSLGYRAHNWRLGRNRGVRTAGRDDVKVAERIDQISDGGRNKVSLVGHSLGGVMARRYAVRHPDRVRQVICLGSPFVGNLRAVNPMVLQLHDVLSGEPALPPASRRPPTLKVPFTAIYSRTDGIVAASDCTDVPGPRSENIEVFGSHCGLVHHPAVFYAVADRLALPEGKWAHFRPEGWVRALYGRGSRACELAAQVAKAAALA
jgi:pimeloyl-ACP methyl ester carboxylesterase